MSGPRRYGPMLGVLALWLIAQPLAAGLRYNRTPSVPTGWYWIDRADRRAIPGSYVLFCPPTTPALKEASRRGYIGTGPCPGGVAALLKVVAASPGDIVQISRAGVRINGHLWPDSAPLERDAIARTLPRLQGTHLRLGEHDFLPLSASLQTGFDARYFGPVPHASILGRAWPLWGTAKSAGFSIVAISYSGKAPDRNAPSPRAGTAAPPRGDRRQQK